MMDALGRFLAGPLGSFLRVLVSAILGAAVAYLVNGGTLSGLRFDDFTTWLGLGLASALPVLIAYLNPQDPRFGHKA